MACYQYPYQSAGIAEACKRTTRKGTVNTMYDQVFVHPVAAEVRLQWEDKAHSCWEASQEVFVYSLLDFVRLTGSCCHQQFPGFCIPRVCLDPVTKPSKLHIAHVAGSSRSRHHLDFSGPVLSGRLPSVALGKFAPDHRRAALVAASTACGRLQLQSTSVWLLSADVVINCSLCAMAGRSLLPKGL